MSLHPANLRAVGIGQFLEGLNDEELRSAMAQASALLRQRERTRSDQFRRKMMELETRAAREIKKGARP